MAGVEFAKYTVSNLRDMTVHFDNAIRKLEQVKHGNQSIDKAQTDNNYYINAESYNSMIEAIERMVEEADREHPPLRIRADRKTCFGLEVPCPPELEGTSEEDEFYQDVFDMYKAYLPGLVGGCVHKDEKHEYYDSRKKAIITSRNQLHLFGATITDDGRCNCKSTITPEICKKVNDDIQTLCLTKYHISYQTGEGRIGQRRSVEQLKAESLIAQKQAEYASLARMQEYEDRVNELSIELADSQKEKQKLDNELSELKDTYNKFKKSATQILFQLQHINEQNRLIAKKLIQQIQDAKTAKEKELAIETADRAMNVIANNELKLTDYQKQLLAKVSAPAKEHRNNDFDFDLD